VHASKGTEREGRERQRGIAPVHAVAEGEPHRLSRPARKRAAQDANAEAPDDQAREVAHGTPVVHHGSDHRLSPLGACHELDPLTGLEENAVG
jgi:hypothetical protein